MTCDCLPDASGNPSCQGLAAPAPYLVYVPITQTVKDRMRGLGWAPITETLVRERERVLGAAVDQSWSTQTFGRRRRVIDIGTLENILETE